MAEEAAGAEEKKEAAEEEEKKDVSKDVEQVETTADEGAKDTEGDAGGKDDDDDAGSEKSGGGGGKKGGKGKKREPVNLTASKPYSQFVDDLVNSTPVRYADLDPRAVKLLDILHQRGGDEKVQSALETIRKGISGLQREGVSNWRAYLYTLLKGAEPEAYQAMKDSAEVVKAIRSTIEDRKPPQERQRPLPAPREGTRSAAPLPPTGKSKGKGKGKGKGKNKDKDREETPVSRGKFALASYDFNTTAAEFVPGAGEYKQVNDAPKIRPIQVADTAEGKGRGDRRKKGPAAEEVKGVPGKGERKPPAEKLETPETPEELPPLTLSGLCPCGKRKPKTD